MNEPKDKINNEELISSKGKILSKIVYFLFIVLFIWIFGQLFFKAEVSNSVNVLKNFIFGADEQTHTDLKDLKIIYAQYNVSLEPTRADPETMQVIINVYESLVKHDMNMNIVPALALSYGLIDEYTWKFILRPDVEFQDGSSFGAEDVVASIERAKSYPLSELKTMTDSIEAIKIIDDYTLQIHTYTPDPLLLHKLSSILIIPSEYQNKEISTLIGTGPYIFDSWDKENGITKFKAFEDYWGNKPKFNTISLISILDKSERINTFLQGGGHLLTTIPYEAIDAILSNGFSVTTIPSLEVDYLVFDINSEFLNDQLERKTLSLAIDPLALIDKLGAYVREVSQFVSNGVFGFNSNILKHEYDLEKAKILAEETSLKGKTLKFHLPIGLEVLGEHIRKSLLDAGIYVVVSYLETDKLYESIENKDADIYFAGFKSGFGDSTEFLQSSFHSKGDFNIFGYSNPQIDELIDSALIEFDEYKRRSYLQEAMKIITEDDVIGLPLFEYETVYSFVDKIEFSPRIDGYIYFDEIIVK